MDLTKLAIRDQLQESVLAIFINFNKTNQPFTSSNNIEKAIFHKKQKINFEDLKNSLSIMVDFLYGKNKAFNKRNTSLYATVNVIAHAYLLKYMMQERRNLKSASTFNLGLLPDEDLNYEATLTFLAFNLEDQIISAIDCIGKHHKTPIIFAKEVNELMLEFIDFINPIIKSNILMPSKRIDLVDIYNSSWKKRPFIHYMVFGGIYREVIIQRKLSDILSDIKYCNNLVAA